MADDFFGRAAEFCPRVEESACGAEVGDAAVGRYACAAEEYDVVAVGYHLFERSDLIVHVRHFFLDGMNGDVLTCSVAHRYFVVKQKRNGQSPCRNE